MTEVLEISSPQYTVEKEPEHKLIGKLIDDLLREHFTGQTVVVRGISSKEHPNKTIDQLIELIK